AFIGPNPKHLALVRGVKIIGASAHFVKNELDVGPIILQDVTSVTHANTAEMIAKMGKDVEKTVFCKALQ
ncbi:formyltransferase family protein, partial [Pseudoalteromonas issachenkonii]